MVVLMNFLITIAREAVRRLRMNRMMTETREI